MMWTGETAGDDQKARGRPAGRGGPCGERKLNENARIAIIFSYASNTPHRTESQHTPRGNHTQAVPNARANELSEGAAALQTTATTSRAHTNARLRRAKNAVMVAKRNAAQVRDQRRNPRVCAPLRRRPRWRRCTSAPRSQPHRASEERLDAALRRHRVFVLLHVLLHPVVHRGVPLAVAVRKVTHDTVVALHARWAARQCQGKGLYTSPKSMCDSPLSARCAVWDSGGRISCRRVVARQVVFRSVMNFSMSTMSSPLPMEAHGGRRGFSSTLFMTRALLTR